MIAQTVRSVSMACAIVMPIITAHEGLRTSPYDDIVGVRTVCYGETQNVEERQYTEAECLMLLALRVAKDFERPISKCTQNWNKFDFNVRASMITYAWNLGPANYCTSSMKRALDVGNVQLACDSLLLWNKAKKIDPATGKYIIDPKTGKPKLFEIPGLTKRRQAERQLCLGTSV